MKIAVIGAGAVGGYFGGRLAASGSEVVFLVRGKTLEALRTGPLRVQSIGGDFQVNVHATDDPAEIGEVDAVLIAVKAWQVPEAAAAIQKMPGRNSVIVPLQNGMEAPAALAAVLGPGRVAGGLCRIVAEAKVLDRSIISGRSRRLRLANWSRWRTPRCSRSCATHSSPRGFAARSHAISRQPCGKNFCLLRRGVLSVRSRNCQSVRCARRQNRGLGWCKRFTKSLRLRTPREAISAPTA
ncbi:MAG: 2-dehydropantoate 2-reductase [Verrucomicrobiota bacterium]